MLLKFYRGRILLHLINHATRLSVSSFCQSINITVKVTAAESPFSNQLVERHNFIIVDMMDKALEESQHLDMNLTLAWCLNAKHLLEPLRGGSLLFNTKFPEIPGTHFINLRRLKG